MLEGSKLYESEPDTRGMSLLCHILSTHKQVTIEHEETAHVARETNLPRFTEIRGIP